MLDPGFAVRRVQVDVGEPHVVQPPLAEHGQLAVQVLADPRDLALGDPGVRAQGLDQVVDRSRGHAVDVGLHDDGEQGLVDPAAPFQQDGEETARPQLGDAQPQVAGLGGEGLLPVAVAQGGARVGVLVPFGSDPGRGLGLDQLL